MANQEVQVDIQSSGSPTANQSIDRRENLSYEEFKEFYEKPFRPVIITGALKNWKALTKWTPEFFKNRYSSKIIVPELGEAKEYRMDEYIDLVTRSSSDTPVPYFRNVEIREEFPDLFEDINPDLPYFFPNWLHGRFAVKKLNEILHRGAAHELYIGGSGTRFPNIHYDGYHTHAFICHIYGRKEFIAYSPDQTPYMHPKTKLRNRSNVNDPENPDLTRFPMFAHARPMRFYLEPGETLFIPSGWWHTARLLSPAISVSVNVSNRSNWDGLTNDFCFQIKQRSMVVPLAAYLTAYKFYKLATESPNAARV